MIANDFDAMRIDAKIFSTAQRLSFGMAPTATNTPGVGLESFEYLTPHRVVHDAPGESNRVIHRGIVEQEMHNGVAAVRLYMAIFAESKPDAENKVVHKDGHASAGNITTYAGGDHDTVLWVNAGQPLRALEWFEKYKIQDAQARPLIRSFLIPNKVFKGISERAIVEHDAGRVENKAKTFNVDRHFASDQFGVRGDDIKLISISAIRNSLVTYVDDMINATPAFSGQLVYTQVLRERLGVPRETIEGVWVDPVTKGLASKGAASGLANKLMNIYGCWTGNALYVSPFYASGQPSRPVSAIGPA